MRKVDLTDLIEVTERESDSAIAYLTDKVKTEDKVFLPTEEEILEYRKTHQRNSLTISDYAICRGGNWGPSDDPYFATDRERFCNAWLQDCEDCCGEKYAKFVTSNLSIDSDFAESPLNGVVPMVNLNLEKFEKLCESADKILKNPFEISHDIKGDVHMNFGQYPQGSMRNVDIVEEKVVKFKDGRCEGIDSIEDVDKKTQVITLKNKDVIYCVTCSSSFETNTFYFKPEPISWTILNWNQLPKSINKYGTGEAKSVTLMADTILDRVKFSSSFDIVSSWSDSNVRSFLNDTNFESVSFATRHGRKVALASEPGFMKHAFEIEVPEKSPLAETLDVAEGKASSVAANYTKEALNKAWAKASKMGQGDFAKNFDKFVKEYEKSGQSDQNNDEKHESNVDFDKIKEMAEHEQAGGGAIVKKRTRLQKLNPDTTPNECRRFMTDTEMIKNWIDAGQSVLLRGPSGIGKTERLKSLYPDLIYIKLTNNMFPEKVVGSVNLQTGQNIPPDFAKQAILSCATSKERKLVNENIQNLYEIANEVYERSKNSDKKTVILLDELLNVKPAVQSLVYTLVLNKIVETGNGLKLPANTVVVATGNQKKYSLVAEDLAEPLEKRFDHILDMQPKVGEWLSEYAISKGVHPAVVGYIMTKYSESGQNDSVNQIKYFYEEPEVGQANLDANGCNGRTNDPRGWESVSRTLYAFEKDLKNGKFAGKNVEKALETSLGSKLRGEWAREFYDFYNASTLSVEDVVSGNFDAGDLPQSANERFATMTSLLLAKQDELEKCRIFVRAFCDPEYLSLFDILWAGDDDQKKEFVAELEAMDSMQNEQDEQMQK